MSDTHELIGFTLTPGHTSDMKAAEEIIDVLPEGIEQLVADKGYDSDKIRDTLSERYIQTHIPCRSNRKNPHKYSRNLYKQRNVVERFFRFLKESRRIATRYDKLDVTYAGFICLMCSILLLK